MVSCGGTAAIPGRQRSMGKISGFDVVDGSVRSYVRSMGGEPGRGLSGAKGGAGGHFGMRRFAVGGLAGSGGCHGVVTSGAKHGGTEADALRRFLQISGRGGTGWDR